MPDAHALLGWFAAHRRDLPWRGPFPRDPYRVLVSEVLLQQTRVDRAAPAFGAFTARFPTVEALAAAPAEAVVQAFSGLGYYRRARLLHAAARAIAGAGGWPRRAEELADLPGLGPYTAAAIAAFAFAGATPPVDGNLERVAARLADLDLERGAPALRRAAADLASGLFAAAPVPDLFEALMELGALVCTPARPRCAGCPLAGACASAARGSQIDRPRPRRRRAPETHRWVALWVADGAGRIALRRVAGAPLDGLWLPPLATVPPGADPLAVARALASALGLPDALAPGTAVRHTITHRRITVLPFLARLDSPGPVEGALRWQSPGAITLPTSSLTGKLGGAVAVARR